MPEMVEFGNEPAERSGLIEWDVIWHVKQKSRSANPRVGAIVMKKRAPRSMRRMLVWMFAFSLLVVGCGDDDTVGDGNGGGEDVVEDTVEGPEDAVDDTDEGGEDSGMPDTIEPEDTGADTDEGSDADAGTDTGPTDTGTDTGPTDGGTDTGPTDTGSETGTDSSGDTAVADTSDATQDTADATDTVADATDAGDTGGDTASDTADGTVSDTAGDATDGSLIEDVADGTAVLVKEVNCSNVTPAVTIDVGTNFFNPSSPTISAGDVVEWELVGGTHDVTSGTGSSDPASGNLFYSGTMSTVGETYCVKFEATGSYPYYCSIHGAAAMSGTVSVQ